MDSYGLLNITAYPGRSLYFWISFQANPEDAFLVVPGVAFDENRHRAGYGQGFYDRYLAAHRKHATAAVAFEFQIVEEVPAEPTDIFPDLVITEKRILS